MISQFKLILTIFFLIIIFSVIIITSNIGKSKRMINYNDVSISVDTLFQKSSFVDYSLKDIRLKDSLFVLFVSTECDYCHKVLTYIYSEKFALAKSKIVLVFSNSIDDIKSFFLAQNLTKKENIYIYADALSRIRNKFAIITTPSLYFLHNNKISVMAIGLNEFFEKANLIK